METNLLDKMLTIYHSQRTPITLVLQNKARVTGRIETFDSYVIILGSQKQEIVYRHAIASVHPYLAEGQDMSPDRKTSPAKPAAKPAPLPRQHPKKEQRASPKPAPVAAEPSLNTGMKEGLLRWMQEQKAGK